MTRPYELFGADDAERDARVRKLVDRFYDIMDTRPEVVALRAMHPADLATSRDKLYLFLLGWLGGPQTYTERYGHPRLRARHMPFVIDNTMAVQWMTCMTEALDETVPDEQLRKALFQGLGRLALHMRNSEEPA